MLHVNHVSVTDVANVGESNVTAAFADFQRSITQRSLQPTLFLLSHSTTE